MSMVNAPAKGTQRREDFPIDTFRYLEAKLGEIRRLVMNRAAEIAEDRDSNPEFFCVLKKHVDIALADFLGAPTLACKALGVRPEGSIEKD